jgi:hypothetical protein
LLQTTLQYFNVLYVLYCMAEPDCNIGWAHWVFYLVVVQMISKTVCAQASERADCRDIYQNRFIQNVGNNRCGYWLTLICLEWQEVLYMEFKLF